MSVNNTRTVGDVKVVMLKGQGGEVAHGIPSGGTTGQVLAKSSDTDYATMWVTLKNSRVVELSETNIQTEVGTAKTVTVTYRVAGISDTATYTSSDTSVATVAVTGYSSTGTSATDVITITPVANGDCTIKIAFANEVGYDAEYDYINVTVGSASGGSSIKKTRYAVNASSWSASANSDGYYTYTQTLSPAVKSSPDVYVAGSTDSTQPTDAQRAQFGYVERCKVNGSTLTLYAKTKPTANFYIWLSGEEGTASGDIAGNVVKPNTDTSILTPFELSNTDRMSIISGGYRVDGDIVTIDILAKVLVEPGNTFVFPDLTAGGMDTRIYHLPEPKDRAAVVIPSTYLTYDSTSQRYSAFATALMFIYTYAAGTNDGGLIGIGKYGELGIGQRDIYIKAHGTYRKA